MRVTLATYDDEPPLGGQGVVVRGLRAALREQGVEVHTVAGRGAHAVAVAPRSRRAPLDLSLALNRSPAPLLAADPDVVHAMGGPGGLLLLRRLPVPVVYTAHHTYRQAYPRPRPRRVLGPLEAVAYRRAAAILAVSPSTAEAVRAIGVPAERVRVVAPGIDLERLARAALATPREPGRVLFVGRLEPEKGPLDAVAVMAALLARGRAQSAAVVGRGRLLPQVRAAAAIASSATRPSPS